MDIINFFLVYLLIFTLILNFIILKTITDYYLLFLLISCFKIKGYQDKQNYSIEECKLSC